MGGLAELSDPNAPQSSQLSQILFEAFLRGSGHLYIYICVKIRKNVIEEKWRYSIFI